MVGLLQIVQKTLNHVLSEVEYFIESSVPLLCLIEILFHINICLHWTNDMHLICNLHYISLHFSLLHYDLRLSSPVQSSTSAIEVDVFLPYSLSYTTEKGSQSPVTLLSSHLEHKIPASQPFIILGNYPSDITINIATLLRIHWLHCTILHVTKDGFYYTFWVRDV